MSTTLNRPNPAKNDADQKLENTPLPTGGDADSPYASPEDIKNDIDDRPVIDDADKNTQDNLSRQEKGAKPNEKDNGLDSQEKLSSIPYTNTNSSEKNNPSSTFKRKGLWLILGIGGGGLFTIFNTLIGPAFMLVHVASAVLTGDVSGIVSQVMENRNTHIGTKYARSVGQDYTKKCGLVPIKCRYRGVGPRLQAKLKMQGIDIKCGRSFVPGRCNPKRFIDTKTGKSYTPRKWAKKLKNNPDLAKRAHDARYKGVVMTYAGKKAKAKWKSRGIFRGKRGTQAKDDDPKARRFSIRKLFRGMNANNGGETRAKNAPLAEGDDAATRSRNQAVEEGNLSANANDEAARAYGEDLNKAKADNNKPVPPDPTDSASNSKIQNAVDKMRGSTALGTLKSAVVPVALFDEVCRVKAVVKSVSIARKVFMNRQLVAYSFEIMRLANQIKAGDADGDSLQEISNMATYMMTKDGQGESMFDSFGWNWGVGGRVTKQSAGEDITKYQMGGGGAANDVANLVPQTGCDITGNIYVQVGTTAAAAAIAIIPGVGQAAAAGAKAGQATLRAALKLAIKQAIKKIVESSAKENIKKAATHSATKAMLKMGAWEAFWRYIVPPLITTIARSMTGTVVTGDEKGKPVGNAFIAGYGAMNTTAGKANGLMPLTKPEAMSFKKEADERKTMLAKMRGQNQLDINDPNSFVSKTFIAVAPSLSSLSVSNFATTVGGFSLRSLSSLTANTYADPSPSAALEICKDDDYEKMDLAVDPFCNPQYGFSFKTMDSPEYNAEAVVDYMFDGGYIDEKGEPLGDYGSFLETCVEADVLNPDDEECMEKDVKHKMFSLYTMDTSIHSDINEDDDEEEADNQGSGVLVDGSSQELAKQIMKSGNIEGSSQYIDQIKAYASGKSSCHLNRTILQLLATMIEEGYKISISSLNRKCTGSTAGAGTASYHWKGSAVDIQALNGKPVTGADELSIKFLKDLAPLLQSGSGVGQADGSCRPPGKINWPKGVTEFSDSCNHIHIQVPQK